MLVMPVVKRYETKLISRDQQQAKRQISRNLVCAVERRCLDQAVDRDRQHGED